MDTYYEDILKKVEDHISEEDFQSAFKILEEELSMPYIPRDYEEKLIAYYNQCRSELRASVPIQKVEEDVATLLQGSLDEQFLAIEQLKKSNIRNHLEEIQTYLSGNPHYLVRSFLMEALMEQNITEELTTEIEGLDVTFTPCYIEPPMDSDGVVEAVGYIKDWFENDNPTFTLMCVETLIKEAYLRLPFNIESEEALSFALAIARYVFVANGEEEAWKVFLSEKELAQTSGYELLLSRHDIL
ncbi:MAG: DUF3196 family protein [Longicatena sp.]